MAKQIYKKGQLTLFVILAVFVVLGIGLYFTLSSSTSNEASYDPEVQVLKENLLDCFELQYRFALDTTAQRGGYFEIPKINKYVVYELGPSFIPYYYNAGENLLPTLAMYENELSKEIKTYIPACIDLYADEQNASGTKFDLSYTDISVDTNILEGEVSFKTDIKVTAQYENKTVTIPFSRDEVFIDSDLLAMHEIATIVVNQAVSDPLEWIDITELYFATEERDLTMEIIDIAEETESYMFTIDASNEEFYPLQLRFLMKYKLEEVNFPQGISG